MPFSISWDDADRTILFISAEGEWSIDDFLKALNTVVAYLHRVSHPVFIIDDVRQSAAPPLGIIWHSRDMFQRLPENYVGSIVVTTDNLWRNVVTTVNALYVKNNSRLIAARTLEEAHEIVRKWKVDGH